MWTVTLKLWPQVVALHLLGGFTTLSLLTLLTLRLRRRPQPEGESPGAGRPPGLRRFRPWLYGGLALVVMQIALGAWTAANYAAVACTDLPTCQGEWWPAEMDFQHGFDVTQHVGPNYLGGQLTADGRVAIHVSHRLGAMIVLAYFTVFLALLWRRTKQTPLAWHVQLVAVTLITQIALGLANKDMKRSMELAQSLDAELPMCEMVEDLYKRAVEKYGFDQNHLMAVKLLEEANQTFLRGS